MPSSEKQLQTVSRELSADVSGNPHPKLHRTLASFSALMVNVYIIMALKIAPPSVELSLLFWLLFFVSMIIAGRERDASYCFTPMTLATTPFILWGAGLGAWSAASVVGAIVTIGFQRGITMSSIASGASDIAEGLSNTNIRRKIVKLSGSEIEPDSIHDEELKEFTEVEAELLKVQKVFDRANPNMQRMLKQTIAKVEQLQKDHARVLVRGAGLASFLASLDIDKIRRETDKLTQEAARTSDEVAREQLLATVKMKQKRLSELNELETCLNRVKIQKMQIYEMFSSLMDKMHALRFADIKTMQAS
ncbi:MAG: hypothetical protein AB1403_21415, partial [Candidatus Riflebacteria bacterium]